MLKQFLILNFIAFGTLVFSGSLASATITAMQGSMISGMAQSVVSTAGESEVAQMLGAGTNLIIGGMMVYQNCDNPEGSGMDCAMGALMVAQGGAMAESSGDTGDAGRALTQNPFGGLPSGGTPTIPDFCAGLGPTCSRLFPDGNIPNPVTPKDIKTASDNLMDRLRRQGITVTPDLKQITLGDKGTFPSDVISDPDALVDAGFDQAAVSSLFNKMDGMSGAVASAFKDRIRRADGSAVGSGPSVEQMGFSSGGGGGRRSRRAGSKFVFDSKNPFADMLKNLKNKKRKPATAAGMTKRLPNGELIGVKSDNIFEMIHRRYRQKARQNQFLPPNHKGR